jgi:ribose transport system permease protein
VAASARQCAVIEGHAPRENLQFHFCRDLPLSSLVAVILGGVTFGSGKGGAFGPAVAAFMLTFSFNLLTSLGLGEPAKLMLQGAIIAVAAASYSAQRRS